MRTQKEEISKKIFFDDDDNYDMVFLLKWKMIFPMMI